MKVLAPAVSAIALFALAIFTPPVERAVSVLAVAGTPSSVVYLPETHGGLKVAALPTATFTATPSPTSTSTATATATRTSTATATPTATATIAGSVSVIGATSVYSSSGTLRVFGEVKNTTGSYTQFVKIVINLFNGVQLVANDFTYTYLDKLAPNEKTCFNALVFNAPPWTSYTLEQPTYSATTAPVFNIAFVSPSGSANSATNYRILGQMRNDGAGTTTFVQSIATLYDSVGTAVGCDFTYVNSTDLTAGQTSSFTNDTLHSPDVTVASYRLQADGRP